MHRTVVVLYCALVLLVPCHGSAQALQSFEDLTLRVNLDDQLQVEDQSGANASGRLTRDEITIQTDAGEKSFTSDTVRGVAMRGHAPGKGALIGAGVFALLGAVAVSKHGDAGAGAFGAATIGAGAASGALADCRGGPVLTHAGAAPITVNQHYSVRRGDRLCFPMK